MSKLRAFCMPKWGIEMSEGTIAEWKVEDGQNIKKGDVICLIETDKITNEVEAERDEVLLRIVETARDEAIAVGELLAVMGDDAADAAEIDAFVEGFTPASGGVSSNAKKDKKPGKQDAPEELKPDEKTPAKKAAKIDTNRPISPKALQLAEAEAVDLSEITGSGRDGRITYQDVHQHIRPQANPVMRGATELPPEDRSVFASPLARRLGAIHGVDLSQLTGTGPRGRISKKDVLAVADQSGSASRGAPFTLVANEPKVETFDKMRRVVAKRLTAAKQDIPHYYLRISVVVDELLAMRKTANMVLGSKASVNDFIVLASAKALVRHPDINIQLHGEDVHKFKHADIAVAVASPKGLVTPIVRQADRMRIEQIAETTSGLIEKAGDGRLAFDDMDGGTFTISNLGMFGVEEFTAIINPPQGAILAVGAASRDMVMRDDGEIGMETRIKLNLSLDHRAIDGAAGAQFLATLKEMIEQPEKLFN